MTYLDLINKVLLRLRERRVDTIGSDYSLLVGEFVNEAKEDVERAWMWKALRSDITFNTVSGQQDYNLGAGGVASPSPTNERSRLMYEPMTGEPVAFLRTDPYEGNRLIEVERETHKQWIADDGSSNQVPTYFSLTKSNDGWTVSIYPKPDGVYSVQMTWFIPQETLDEDTDELTVPAEPVWRLALAMAAAERGEGLGAAAERYEARAKKALIDAVSLEADPAELTAYEV